MIESVNRVTCDGCGKSVERGTSVGDQLPTGWVVLEVRWDDPNADELSRVHSRSGDFHSKPCAARWLLKRERKARQQRTPEEA